VIKELGITFDNSTSEKKKEDKKTNKPIRKKDDDNNTDNEQDFDENKVDSYLTPERNPLIPS
jgi:hypothetical protein